MARVRRQGDERPMRGPPDALADLRNILNGREMQYSKARAHLDTSGAAFDESTAALLDIIKESGFSAIIVLAVSAVVLMEWWTTGSAHLGLLLRVGTATGIVAVAIFIFDRFLWSWGWLQGWFVHRPHIGGIWDVKINPLTADPTTGKPRSKRTYQYHIQQTYSKLFIRMTNGPESEGESITADIRRLDDGEYELVIVYLNTPKAKIRNRSEIHFGTAKLSIVGNVNSPTTLRGSYWPERERIFRQRLLRGRGL